MPSPMDPMQRMLLAIADFDIEAAERAIWPEEVGEPQGPALDYVSGCWADTQGEFVLVPCNIAEVHPGTGLCPTHHRALTGRES